MLNKNHILLPLELDKQALKDELSQIVEMGWNTQKPFSTQGVPGLTTTVYHDGSWKVISLRSIGGDDKRTDPGGPSLADYQYTKYATKAPYIKSILEKFGEEYVRTVRLSVLHPGESIEEHSDTYIALKYGQVRLHVPIQTNDQVEMSIGGEKRIWREGELWYGDFAAPHSVINKGDTPRVHLMFDVCVNEKLLAMFTSEQLDLLGGNEILAHQLGLPLPKAELANYTCQFPISAGLIKGIFEFDDGIPGENRGSLSLVNDDLIFYINNTPIFSLIPVAINEFRFTGWTMERTLSCEMENGQVSSVSFNINSGLKTTKVVMPVNREASLPAADFVFENDATRLADQMLSI
jgi:hypothetical protein